MVEAAVNKAWDGTAREDDALVKETLGESGAVMVVGEKAAGHLHELPEQWLRSRVRGWMELCESPDLAFWIGTYTPEGRWIYCSSDNDTYVSKTYRQLYAMVVAKHLNKHCNFGGAWLAGWFRGGKEFYLLHKDVDGDLKTVVESNKPFIVLAKWAPEDWERLACTAYVTAGEMRRNSDADRKQGTVKLAQGEKPSQNHLTNAPEAT